MALQGHLNSLVYTGGSLALAPSGHHHPMPARGPQSLVVEALLLLFQIHQRGPSGLYLMLDAQITHRIAGYI